MLVVAIATALVAGLEARFPHAVEVELQPDSREEADELAQHGHARDAREVG
eukprot:CAMPEP_0117570502 /NCGR_PEP_ID=MMETSP0784-20121206/59233_1 /TAXON_ID=39447 /ORGANISM="" /LENGTH=50 /DNA_ID=CAMNT_0005368561 /DNA_START=145 /DNA_END=297 /DNA_ORIENTATION=-